MKAGYISSTLKPGAAGFTVQRMLFEAQDGKNRREFEIVVPFNQLGRGIAEGLKFKGGWPTLASAVSLKFVLGTTTVTKTWTKSEDLQGEYVLDFCLDLHLKTKDDKPTFGVELEIKY